MIRNMLMAASKMLAGSKEEKVICAKIIIDEIVTGMQTESEEVPEISLKKSAKKVPQLLEPEIGVKHGKLVEIKNVPLEGMIKLDGVEMTHAEAIGKSFQNIDILWRP